MLNLPTTPQSIGKVLDTGFKLFSISFTRIVPWTFLIAILSLLPNVLFPDLHSADETEVQKALTAFLIFLPVFILLMLWLSGVLIYRLGAIMYDLDDSVSFSMLMGLKKILPLLIAAILYLIAVMLGTLALLLPGIFLSLSLFFYMPLIMMDKESVFGSLKRSHHLVWNNWWRTATVFAVPLAVYIALIAILGTVLGIIFAVSGNEFDLEQFRMIGELLNVVLSTLLTPLFYAVMMAQYHDLKLRKEGGDLERRLAQKDFIA